jgi:polysaccharide pyruvyl transferase WcaK-like protein
LAAALAGSAGGAGRAPRILLRSSWQTVNIGDIAHTPGVLALLEEHLPEAEVTLWPSKVDHGVDDLLRKRFPKLRIAADAATVDEALERCDFLLHGSGPSLVAERDVLRWKERTGKPYGVYGITFAPKSSASTVPASGTALARTVEALNGARFVYFRDSVSLAFAREQGCTAPVMEFSPDGAFACDLRDDAAAEAFLAAQGLERGGFLCCIPRLRYTPYWTIPDKKAAFDAAKHARNEEMKEQDARPLREAIVAVVRETSLRVLLCPEDRTQMAVGKEMLLDRLPEDVRAKVAWRPDYWLTGEAVSTYVRSAGLFGHEMHSPILCVGHGIPAIVCRWAEQTSKGFMWRDIGLGDWLFDLDREDEAARVAAAVLALARDPEAARAKAEAARDRVRARFRETMAVVAASAVPVAG